MIDKTPYPKEGLDKEAQVEFDENLKQWALSYSKIKETIITKKEDIEWQLPQKETKQI